MQGGGEKGDSENSPVNISLARGWAEVKYKVVKILLSHTAEICHSIALLICTALKGNLFILF